MAITSNAVDDWRGLATAKSTSSKRKRQIKNPGTKRPQHQMQRATMPQPTKSPIESELKNSKRSRYIRPNFVAHELLLHETLLKVPILRSGDENGLLAISLKKCKITLTNTCPFDSVFQLFLSAALDYKEFLEFCGNLGTDFLALVHKVATQSLNSGSYRKRAQILSEVCPIAESRCGVDLIDCQMTVGGLCCVLFKEVPSLTEIIKCSEGCSERQVLLPRIQVNGKCAFRGAELAQEIENVVNLEDRRCGNNDCESDKPPHVIAETGKI